MDVEDVLKYQPSLPYEDNDNGQPGPSFTKRQRLSQAVGPVEEGTAEGPVSLDEPAVRRLLISFERKVLKNREMRVKFSDDPSKFMDSEMQLFDCLQELHVLSTQPETYRMTNDMIPHLLGMLSHENADLACAAVSLIHELLDMDDVEEEKDHVLYLMKSMMDQQLLPLLVSNMSRLNEEEKEESEGLFNTLAIIENISDADPEILLKDKAVETLINWLLSRISNKSIPFNSNKLYSSEILSILLQGSTDNKILVGKDTGMDLILRQVAHYKKRQADTTDEKEFVDNLFDILCSSLFSCQQNRNLFYQNEGIELMLLLLRDKRSSSSVKRSAVKVLSHVFTLDDAKDEAQRTLLADCCNKLVQIGGLRLLFPVFLKPQLVISGLKKREVAAATDQVEEHCLTVITSLLRHSDTDQQKRIVAKFVEFEYEKTERLLELHYKYMDRVSEFDRANEDDEEEDEDEKYLTRLSEGGLFVLQLVDQLLVMTCLMYEQFFSDHTEQQSVRQRVDRLLKTHAAKVDHISLMRNVLCQMADQLDDEDEKKRLTDLVRRF